MMNYYRLGVGKDLKGGGLGVTRSTNTVVETGERKNVTGSWWRSL
jgi:hypothetical protein